MIWIMLILFPQKSNLLIKKLCWMCLKTTKQWSRWSSREEARHWDMFPEPTELLLIGYLIESIWTLKSKSNTLTPKTSSQTYWPRETSHVMNGITFWVSTSAISVLQIVLKWCRKERKKIQMKKESQQSRTPDDKFGLAMQWTDSLCATFYCINKARWKTRHESQFPLSSRTEQHHRTGRPVEDACSSSYSEWNVDKTWSSQEWKSDELMEDRTGATCCIRHSTRTDSLLKTIIWIYNRNRIRNVVRIQIILAQGAWSSAKEAVPILKKMQQKTATNILWYGECLCLPHFYASVFMVKNYSDNLLSIKNTEDLTMKQMFGISEKIDIRTIRRDLWSEYN